MRGLSTASTQRRGSSGYVSTDSVTAHLELAHTSRKTGKLKLAAEHYARVLELDPDHSEARYFVSVVSRSETPDSIPGTLVRDLFDDYAATYDRHVVGTLHYRGHELLLSAIAELSDLEDPFESALDLGCGTGLCGAAFRDIVLRLVGVDISPRMIEKARDRYVYDSLAVGDFGDVLRESSDAYDLILAADVLGYVGDLGDVFAGCAGALREGGRFAFTAEMAREEAAWVYVPGGRYAQGCRHIEQRAVDSGFDTEYYTTGILRQETGIPVSCHVVVLRLNATT